MRRAAEAEEARGAAAAEAARAEQIGRPKQRAAEQIGSVGGAQAAKFLPGEFLLYTAQE